MSKIALSSNPSGTGTFTLASPATNTDRTLTLPDVTTTLVGADATQTLTNKTIASSQLTGALPAIDGSALTGIATGGMTLLGTINTTSGTTVTLSGLTLTSYKKLEVWINAVSLATSNASALYLNSGVITPSLATLASGWFGAGWLDLATGNGVFTTNTGVNASGSATSFGSVHGLTTASTSISFQTAAGTFDAGSITIYGVK
jgi:hypothetical protein